MFNILKPVLIGLITPVFKYVRKIELANESDIMASKYVALNLDILYRRANGNISSITLVEVMNLIHINIFTS